MPPRSLRGKALICLETMFAVVKPSAAPGSEIREVPIPQFGFRGDVLVKVQVASILRDRLTYLQTGIVGRRGAFHPPLIPGHDVLRRRWRPWAAKVTSVKEGDFRLRPKCTWLAGKCFSVPHRRKSAHLPEREDHWRRRPMGHLAEYVVIPESNIWKLDPAIPQE